MLIQIVVVVALVEWFGAGGHGVGGCRLDNIFRGAGGNESNNDARPVEQRGGLTFATLAPKTLLPCHPTQLPPDSDSCCCFAAATPPLASQYQQLVPISLFSSSFPTPVTSPRLPLTLLHPPSPILPAFPTPPPSYRQA